jgi:hypothetical protein
MTLAGPWLLAAMSEGGTPSARRVVMVIGLLLFAPLLLLAALRWAPETFGLCFATWCAICGGVYVGGSFAPARDAPKEPAT